MAGSGVRVVGIVLTAVVLIAGGLVLLLGTTCAFSGYQSQPPNLTAGLVWLFFFVLFVVGCVHTIVRLVKGLGEDEFASLDLKSRALPPQGSDQGTSYSSIENEGNIE